MSGATADTVGQLWFIGNGITGLYRTRRAAGVVGKALAGREVTIQDR